MNRRRHFTYSQCGGPRWPPANLAAGAWVGRLCFADAEGARRARAASALGCKALNEIEKHGPADARRRPALGRNLPRIGSSRGLRTATSPYVALYIAKIHSPITPESWRNGKPHVFRLRERARLGSIAIARSTIQPRSHSGNFSAFSIARNRGSWRRGSMSGSVLRNVRPGSRSRHAVSSHSSAFALSPHCAWTVAN